MTKKLTCVCRMEGCTQQVPAALAQDRMCLDHFVEHTYARARRAVAHCQEDLPFTISAVEWMFEDAKFSLMALVRDLEQPYREQLSELMICLANLHEYVRYHAEKDRAVGQPALDAQEAAAKVERGAA